MQEAVRRVGGGAAGVVAHADGEDGVLGGRHGHAGAGRDLQDDEPEARGDGVREPGERGVLAVAAEQFRVLRVAGGEQFGLEPEGDEAGGVGGVTGGDPPLAPVPGHLADTVAGLGLTLGVVVGHGGSLGVFVLGAVGGRWVRCGWAAPAAGLSPAPPLP